MLSTRLELMLNTLETNPGKKLLEIDNLTRDEDLSQLLTHGALFNIERLVLNASFFSDLVLMKKLAEAISSHPKLKQLTIVKI